MKDLADILKCTPQSDFSYQQNNRSLTSENFCEQENVPQAKEKQKWGEKKVLIEASSALAHNGKQVLNARIKEVRDSDGHLVAVMPIDSDLGVSANSVVESEPVRESPETAELAKEEKAMEAKMQQAAKMMNEQHREVAAERAQLKMENKLMQEQKGWMQDEIQRRVIHEVARLEERAAARQTVQEKQMTAEERETGSAQHEAPATPVAQAVPLAFKAKAPGDPDLRTVYTGIAEAVPLDATANAVRSTLGSAAPSAAATTGPAAEGKTKDAKRTYQGIVQLEKQARALLDLDSLRHPTNAPQALKPGKGSMMSAGTASKGQGLKVQLQELVDKEAHVVAQMEAKRLERDLHA